MGNWDSSKLYDIYKVRLQVRGRICGGTPKNPDLIDAWLKAKTGHNDKLTEEQAAEIRETLMSETEENNWTTFQADATGLFLPARNVKAMFKESSTLLGITKKKRGSKQILQHAFEIKGENGSDRIYLRDEKGNPKRTHDGDEENPIHVVGPQGPRTALKRFDYCERPIIEFEVWVFKTQPAETRHIGEKELEAMLVFSQENGLGANRSQGYGKHDILAFEKAQSGTTWDADTKKKEATKAA